jgi:hypothetical protein
MYGASTYAPSMKRKPDFTDAPSFAPKTLVKSAPDVPVEVEDQEVAELVDPLVVSELEAGFADPFSAAKAGNADAAHRRQPSVIIHALFIMRSSLSLFIRSLAVRSPIVHN